MNQTIEQQIGEFREKYTHMVRADHAMPYEEFLADSNFHPATKKDIESWLKSALEQAERRGHEEGYMSGQKHAFNVDRERVKQEGRDETIEYIKANALWFKEDVHDGNDGNYHVSTLLLESARSNAGEI